ncbi:MAG: hypothetical protein ACI91R_002002 [Vicingaceae bacterium]|jgi:hypothetical protein
MTITDDPNFGCTIEFSDSEDKDDELMPFEDLMHPKDKYLLIQKSYPEEEEEEEEDWYSLETSESDVGLSYKNNMYVNLDRSMFGIE